MTEPSSFVKPRRYLHVALQSALAAAVFLGFPAGLQLWLILLREASHTSALDPWVELLQANGLNAILILTITSLGWSFLLGRISGYRAWWKIGFATALGIIVTWFSPLSNLDGWLADGLPMHLLYAIAMCGIVYGETFFVGLAYGIILHSLKAALSMAFTTSFVSVLALLLTILAFDQFGIRVGGEVPFAMSKVTTVSLMISAIVGGAVLGLAFSRFVEINSRPLAKLIFATENTEKKSISQRSLWTLWLSKRHLCKRLSN